MRPLRKINSRMADGEAVRLLTDCEYAVLATINADDGSPYCIGISPAYSDGKLYFHCAREGQKNDNILHDSRVCITCADKVRAAPELFTTTFESVVAVGNAAFVEDDAEKLAAMRLICEKYAASNMERFEKVTRAALPRLAVCRVTVTELCGKRKRGIKD